MSIEKSYEIIKGVVRESINTCVSLLKVALRSKPLPRFPVAESESCLILGNGPSLKTSLELYPASFSKHTLFCVNNFAVASEFETLRPQYYLMLDPGFWVKEPHETIQKCILSLQQKTTWKLQLFLPVEAKNTPAFNNLALQNRNIELVYFNYTVFKGFEKIAHYFYRKNLAMPQSQNILVASLFIAVNSGFKRIYLTGADHNWHQQLHIDENNQLCIKDVHFYENAGEVNYRPFYKNFAKKELFTMHELMISLGKVFYGYEALKKYADKQQVVIYNASEVSFIDAFKKVKL